MLNAVITFYLRMVWLVSGRSLRANARDPQALQEKVLRAILVAQQHTTFGKQHGFADIRNYARYRDAVPVHDFEALRPYIEAQQRTGETVLTAESPMCYMRTSGTTSQPKDIPLVFSHLHALRRLQRLSFARQLAMVPDALKGSLLAITSPAQEGMLANGKPYGSASGVIATGTPAIIRRKFVVPADVFAIADTQVKHLLILRLALSRPDITYVATANPTTLLVLAKLYREHEDVLLADVHKGGFFLRQRVPPLIWQSIAKRLRPNPQRATELSRLRTTTEMRRLRDLWPQLRIVVAWTCASAGVAIKALQAELAEDTRIVELGYMASEFRGTITMEVSADSGLPTFDTHFFEFVERDSWDNGKPQFLTLSQLRTGVDYYVVITTPSGLYRYFINDLVRVTGFFQRTPLLRFVQKGRGVTSITGEKLYESQVISAVNAALEECVIRSRFYIMLADEERFCYRLYIECETDTDTCMDDVVSRVEAKLMQVNIEFQAKHSSGRLQLMQGDWLRPGTHDLFKQHVVAKGQRESQFKPPVLSYAKQVGFDFAAHRRP